MRRYVGACIVLATMSSARADPGNSFVSAGLSVGFGNRGLVLGIEATAGSIPDVYYYGASIGFEVALSPGADQPWGRIYAEGELGVVAIGAGAGPAVLLGNGGGLAFQLTPYLAISADMGSCEGREPFVVVAPFYRYTYRIMHAGLHDGGLFVKSLWSPNGQEDSGICD